MNDDKSDLCSRAKKPLDEGAAELGFSPVVETVPEEFYAAARQNSEQIGLTTKSPD
jgi:hypothetical protein